MTNKPIAYSYIRFSTPGQSGGDSFLRQTERAKEYAAVHDLQIADLKFTDLGRSAYDGTNVRRGGFSDFLAAVKSGKVVQGSYLLVEALDRLSRAPPSQSQKLLLDLIESGIVIVTLMDERVYDKTTVDRDPFALMDSVMKLYAAHEESKKKSDRFQKLYKRRRAENAPIIGFRGPGWVKKRADKKGWEAIPEKAASVVKLFDLTLDGLGGIAIARKANAEKWETIGRPGHSWQQSNISKILKYRGCFGEYQPMVSLDGNLKPIGLPIANYFPAVITEETFNRVQAVLAERSRIPNRRDDMCRNILAGMLICGSCGATLALKVNNSKVHFLNYYYTCADRTRGLTKCPSFHAGDLLAPNAAPRKHVKQKQITSRALLATLLRHIAEHVSLDEKLRSITERLNAVNANLASKQASQANLLAVAEAGGADVGVLATRLRHISDEISELETEKHELQLSRVNVATIQTEDDVDASIGDAITALRDPEATSERARLRDKLLQLVEHIWLWPGIAGFRLKGETAVRWIPLSDKSGALITKPPALPTLRKHLRR